MSAAAPAAAEATAEEEYDGCDGADPGRRLDDSLLRGRDSPPLDRCDDGAAARWRRSPVTATTSMPAINISALLIGREDREGNNGSGVAAEDDDNTDAEAGGYVRNFLEVVLRLFWEGRFGRRRTTTKMTEMNRDNEHKEDIVTRSMFETLC
jgi:hypothetical protein